jgi:hypothetical protein
VLIVVRRPVLHVAYLFPPHATATHVTCGHGVLPKTLITCSSDNYAVSS